MNIVYKNGRNFSRNFFYLASLIIRMVIHFIKKAEIFSRNLFKELFEVESKQKPACGGGVT